MMLLALALIVAPQDPASSPQVDAANFAAWCARLAPVAAEERWREIPWRPTLVDGLRDAAAVERPLLLWLMNGHPLGCT